MNQVLNTPRAKALRDLSEGLASIHIWPMLAWQEIRQRYRRSTLGPFWLTISTGVLLGGMGPLYGRLFGANLATYFPHLTVGYVVWTLIAGIVTEGCKSFTAAEGLIKETRLPLSIHVLHVVFRNLIVFAHNLVIVVIVLFFYPPRELLPVLLVPPAVLMIAINGVWVGLLVGLLCARFRDVPQIIQSLVQVAFFLTPVMWSADSLGRYKWLVNLNPFYHFVTIVQAPLMGHPIVWTSWLAVLGITIVGYVGAFALFVRFRARIAYWV